MPATKTKIICTLGPSSNSESVLRKMALAGMDIARLNFSHGSHQEHKARIELIRKINKKLRRRIKILQDLEGNRIRVGRLRGHGPIKVRKGQKIWLTQKDKMGEGNIIPFDYEGPLGGVRGAEFVFIDDGNIALKIKGIKKNEIETEVVAGEIIKENKGINIPGAQLEFPAITEKDKADIRFGIANKVDFIAQSFVRNKGDVLKVKEIIKAHIPQCLVIAKIENREGIRNIDEIIEVSDGIMVARGDMGVSVPIYEIPIIQKMIIRRCNNKSRFVITATQMLESMTENLRPTRAEATDVANAILDGTDYVMLSAETATGRYPVEAIKIMQQIIVFTEKSSLYKHTYISAKGHFSD